MLIISLPFVSHIFPCEFLIQGSLIYSTCPVHIRSAQDISEDSCFHSQSVQAIWRLLSHSSHLIQPAQSPLSINRSTVFSFWVGPNPQVFPRILPDSSNFPGAIPKFFCKFDIRMISQQSNVFSKFAFIFFSSLVQPFCSSFRSISTIHGGSPHHSQHLKTEEGFLLNLGPFSWRFVVLAWWHPLIIVFDCENSFHPSGAIQESFQIDSP